MVSIFVFLSSSSWCQLILPKQNLSTGTAFDLAVWILFFALNSVPKINLNLLKYSFFNLLSHSYTLRHGSLLCLNTPMLCSGPVLECPFEICFIYLFCSGHHLFFNPLTLQRGMTSIARHSKNITCRGVTSPARHAARSHSFVYISTT